MFSIGLFREGSPRLPSLVIYHIPVIAAGTHERWLTLVVHGVLGKQTRLSCRPCHIEHLKLLDGRIQNVIPMHSMMTMVVGMMLVMMMMMMMMMMMLMMMMMMMMMHFRFSMVVINGIYCQLGDLVCHLPPFYGNQKQPGSFGTSCCILLSSSLVERNGRKTWVGWGIFRGWQTAQLYGCLQK